jgi:5-methylcytosine-specific restriction enzyme B
MDFFKQDEIDLLVQWSKHKYDTVEDKAIYETLKSLYHKIDHWAKLVKPEFAPNGRIDIRRSPINQGGKFERYQWAKIYPQTDSNPKLAYTLSLEESDFVIKIDTVSLSDQDVIRSKYLSYRGDWGNSNIVFFMKSDEVLAMDWALLKKKTLQLLHKLEPNYLELQNLIFKNEDSASIKREDSEKFIKNTVEMNPRNIILYGPPGTGKTYHTIDLAVSLTEGNIENGKDHAMNKETFDKLKILWSVCVRILRGPLWHLKSMKGFFINSAKEQRRTI